MLTVVGGQNDHAMVLFQPLKEVANFLVRIAIMGLFYLGALAKEGIGFIEE